MNPIDTLYYVARAGYEPEEGGRAASWEAGHPCLQAIHTVPPSLQLGMVLQAGGAGASCARLGGRAALFVGEPAPRPFFASNLTVKRRQMGECILCALTSWTSCSRRHILSCNRHTRLNNLRCEYSMLNVGNKSTMRSLWIMTCAAPQHLRPVSE